MAAAAERIEWQTSYRVSKAFRSSTDEACEVALEGAWNAARKPTRDAGCEDGRVGFRVAEWYVLNYFFQYIRSIVERTYQATLRELPVNPRNHPFESNETWLRFYDEKFARLSHDSKNFLTPWLVHIVPLNGLTPTAPDLFMDYLLSKYRGSL